MTNDVCFFEETLELPGRKVRAMCLRVAEANESKLAHAFQHQEFLDLAAKKGYERFPSGEISDVIEAVQTWMQSRGDVVQVIVPQSLPAELSKEDRSLLHWVDHSDFPSEMHCDTKLSLPLANGYAYVFQMAS